MPTWADTASPNFLTAFDAPLTERQVFLRQTYGLFTATLAAAGVGAYVVASTPALLALAAQAMWISCIAWIALGFFEARIANRSNAGGLLVLGLNAVLVSLILGPALTVYVAIGGAALIAKAFALTVTVFGGLTLYVLVTRTDYSWMGGALSMACFGLLGAVLISWFFPFGHIGGLVLTLAAIAILSGVILYETSNVLHHYATHQAPLAAAALFSAFVVLFMWILRLLSSNRD